MSETRRLLEAAAALSTILRDAGIPHAFHGSVLTAVLANAPLSDEIFCLVEGGQTQAHPFRRVRDAIAGNDIFSATHSPWTNRQATIEILPAGETGPRILDSTTVMKMQGIPFVTISEFIRAKLKNWIIRGSDRDAQDISYVLTKYWNRVDINRIPEQDMSQFVARNASVAPAWLAVKRKYGM
ncbi:uncharacterized protein LACBIDRAFT_304324 [Laccaria bicolor S238N-H82]|uniref:Predicted protein n=1 Tax=Laccaria bicolor (strain S238N-H82 / ATCC MYA-4686) TaxID=486041 RepID=B0DLE0_LACBS|nr:uncharacterized protein LACBIDRAFT_304324 [Laccaria bicolor S238N-H82]EDR04550.1 predicted protein [Laccaria bicolor S238N-H82]|eukprot:XP_001884722.1 predicted protein [Laccaria bicolor S238N-H82]